MIQRALLTLALILFLPSIIRSCTCSKEAPGTCPGLQSDDVVFLGTVTDISAVAATVNPDANTDAATNNDAQSATTPITRYHFHIDERFAGPNSPDIDVFSGGDDGDCGYNFKKGDQYIVYTQQETEGRLFATICNGTRRAADGRALLPQLRAMRNHDRVASVFGLLHRADPPLLAPTDDPDDPLPNIKLKLRSKDDRFATSTGPDGVYSFYDVHAGEYQYTADLPARFEFTQKTLKGGLPPFKIPNGACYEYNVSALPTGKIRGGVLGPDGKPLQLASVELYRADRYDHQKPGLWSFQGDTGKFEFDHIGPGQYILVFNRLNREDPNSPYPRTFYPGVSDQSETKIIHVKDGEQLLNANIKLRNGFPTRKVRVALKWKDGRPLGEVTVSAKAETGGNPAAQKIAEGLYQFTLLQSARYSFSAWEDLDPQHATQRHGAQTCSLPARIDSDTITVDPLTAATTPPEASSNETSAADASAANNGGAVTAPDATPASTDSNANNTAAAADANAAEPNAATPGEPPSETAPAPPVATSKSRNSKTRNTKHNAKKSDTAPSAEPTVIPTQEITLTFATPSCTAGE
ncbi:MAG TPA: hypothetical protein VGD60_00610 [Candidatus Acidoferrales bacterium]